MKTIYDKIKQKTFIDFLTFFEVWMNFLSGDLKRMYDYYNGYTSSYPASSFELLRSIQNVSDDILSKILIYRSYLNRNAEFFEILTQFEDVRTKIDTYNTLTRWLGVNFRNGIRETDQLRDYVLMERETVENAARNVGYSDGDQGSLDILTKARTKETDYDLSGGYDFEFNYKNVDRFMRLQTVIGPVSGDKVYSIDILRDLTFEDDDLIVLAPQKTFWQTCQILLSLQRGDNPEFPADGIDKTLLINRTVSATTFPIMMRELQETVSRDDTIKYFTIDTVEYEEDALLMTCSFYSQKTNDKFVLNNANTGKSNS